MWRYGLMALGVWTAWSVAAAQLQGARGGILVAPKRWAHVQLQNGRIKLLHDWVEVGDFAPAALCSGLNQILVFDHFGADPQTGAPIGGDTQCGLQYEDDRYYMGPNYDNRYYANDITSLRRARYAGKEIFALAHAWFWTPPDAEQCYVIILTADSFNCNNPNHDAFAPNNSVIDGVVLDYGVLAPNYSWYYTSVVCLKALGVQLRLPQLSGGPGAYLVVYARHVQGYADPLPDDVILATSAQPALWSTDLTSIGASGARQFDDILPDFAQHTSDECASYTYVACEGNRQRSINFGGMMAFWACRQCPDVTGDNAVNDADLLQVLFRFGTTGTPGTIDADVNCDGTVNDADLLEVLFAFGSTGNC